MFVKSSSSQEQPAAEMTHEVTLPKERFPHATVRSIIHPSHRLNYYTGSTAHSENDVVSLVFQFDGGHVNGRDRSSRPQRQACVTSSRSVGHQGSSA
jgi:hypothetical protein